MSVSAALVINPPTMGAAIRFSTSEPVSWLQRIRVDSAMCPLNEDVFAAGDVTGGPGYVYVAAAGGRVAAENPIMSLNPKVMWQQRRASLTRPSFSGSKLPVAFSRVHRIDRTGG